MTTTVLALLFIAATILLLLSTSSNTFVFIHAFGDSPIGNLDSNDISLPSIAELDQRIQRYNEWLNQSSSETSGFFVPFELMRAPVHKNHLKNLKKKGAANTPLSSSSSSQNENLLETNSVHGQQDGSSLLADEDYESTAYNLKIIAKRDIGTKQPEVRVPAKMILSYHTICPGAARRRYLKNHFEQQRRAAAEEAAQIPQNPHSTSNSKQQQRQKEREELLAQQEKEAMKMDEDENEPFCVVSEFLYDEAQKQETCSVQQEKGSGFELGFEQSMMTLFLAFARFGNHSSSSSTASAFDFFKPMLDLLPRVPASPICTFTESDLSIFPLANHIRNERYSIEKQWRESILGTIFGKNTDDNNNNDADGEKNNNNKDSNDHDDEKQRNRIKTLFNSLFPQDALTLPRFMWAECTLRSKVSSCFTSNVPCIFPVVDSASFRTELSSFSPIQVDPETLVGFKTTLARVERATEEEENGGPSPSLPNSNQQKQLKNDDEEDSSSSSSKKQEDSDDVKRRKKKLRKIRNRKSSSSQQQHQDNDNNNANDDSDINNNAEDGKKQPKQQQRGLLKVFPINNFVDAASMPSQQDASLFDSLYGLLTFDRPIKRGKEVRLDRERRAMPFLSEGIVDRTTRAKCSTVNLPTLSMFQKYQKQIVEKANELTAISPKKIFDDPADVHIAPLHSECLEYIFDKSETRNGRAQLDENLKEEPYTCFHGGEHAVLGMIHFIEKLGLFDTSCTISVLENEKPLEDSTENTLRAVAVMGKLVRSQLERISRALSKIEQYVTKFKLGVGGERQQISSPHEQDSSLITNSGMQALLQKQKLKQEAREDSRKKKKSSNNNNKKKSSKTAKQKSESALNELQKMLEEDKKKTIFTPSPSSTSSSSIFSVETTADDSSSSSRENNQQQQQQQQQQTQRTQSSESVLVIDEDNDDSTSTPRFLAASLQERSSCSPESPTKCKILEDPYPRHALLIHDWLMNEHEGLIEIYEVLTRVRSQVRKAMDHEKHASYYDNAKMI